jgi:hypothetical protein
MLSYAPRCAQYGTFRICDSHGGCYQLVGKVEEGQGLQGPLLPHLYFSSEHTNQAAFIIFTKANFIGGGGIPGPIRRRI